MAKRIIPPEVAAARAAAKREYCRIYKKTWQPRYRAAKRAAMSPEEIATAIAAEREKRAPKQRVWRLANGEHLKAANETYREVNRDRICAVKRLYYEHNRETISAKAKAVRLSRKPAPPSEEEIAAKEAARRIRQRQADVRFRAARLASITQEEKEAYAIQNRKRVAEWQRANPARVRAWFVKNSDRRRRNHAEWRKANIEHCRAVKAAWNRRNPEKGRMYEATRRAAKAKAGGHFTVSDIVEIKLLQRTRCAACRRSIRKVYHIDHIIPLARGGSNYRSNLQLLCQPCNNKKHAKDPIDFMRSLGRLL